MHVRGCFLAGQFEYRGGLQHLVQAVKLHNIIDSDVLEEGQNAVGEVLLSQPDVVLLVHVHELHQLAVLLFRAKNEPLRLEIGFNHVGLLAECALAAVQHMP